MSRPPGTDTDLARRLEGGDLHALAEAFDLHRRHLGAKMRDGGREIAVPDGADATSASMVITLMGHFTSPIHAAARAERAELVRQAVEAMDSIDREVLALRHFEELTNQETAEVLGIQTKAASIRYVRALRRLKVILERADQWTQSG